MFQKAKGQEVCGKVRCQHYESHSVLASQRGVVQYKQNLYTNEDKGLKIK